MDGQQTHEKCLVSLIISQMQMKTTMWYHLKESDWPSIKVDKKKMLRGYGEKETLLHFGGNVNWCSHYGEQYRVSLKY